MLSLLDIAERIQKGPKMDENAWNMALFNKMNQLTKEYDISYPNDGSFFNLDDDLADRAFRAGLDFLVQNGTYCTNTGRIIQFTEEEVLRTIRGMPKQVVVGAGRDSRVIKQRSLEEKDFVGQCPGHHAPFSEDLAPLVVKNFAQVPSGDYIEGFNFAVVDNREIFGMPLEVYAAKREAAWMRQGVAKAGRPGMAIAYYPINTRAAVMIAPIDPLNGLRPTDGILLSVLPDIKVEQDYLAAAIVWEEYGGFKVNGGGSGFVGGFAGGFGGAIVEAIAKALVGFLVYRDTLCATGVYDTATTTTKSLRSSPGLSWANSVVMQALHRHSNTICFAGEGHSSGPGTETHLLELAFTAIRAPINGANMYIPRHSRAQMNASQTPLEPEWMYEVSLATIKSGLTHETGTDFLRKASELFDGRAPEEPIHITDCYDLVSHRPKPAYEEIYLRVKDRLSSLGLEFP
jgi:methylamine--corrinoid protein Co-methyltransferase